MYLVQIDVYHASGDDTYQYRIDGRSIADTLRKSITQLCREPEFEGMRDIWDIRIKPIEQKSKEEIEQIRRDREAKIALEVDQSVLFFAGVDHG